MVSVVGRGCQFEGWQAGRVDKTSRRRQIQTILLFLHDVCSSCHVRISCHLIKLLGDVVLIVGSGGVCVVSCRTALLSFVSDLIWHAPHIVGLILLDVILA